MLNFIVNRRMAVLEYEPEFTSAGWVMRELRSRKQVTISRAFTFREEDVLARPEADDADNQRYRFRFAHRRRGFFVIQGRVLGIRNEVHIADQGLPLERKLFVAERNTGIFRRIAKLKGNREPIIVGGEAEGAIPIDTFQFLLRKFPNSLELDRYASARVETIIGEVFGNAAGARESYERYLSQRKSVITGTVSEPSGLLRAELDKFGYVRETIKAWLAKAESYSERDWQTLIIGVLLLIFPKYVAVLENVRIADFYTSSERTTNRFIDICLVDALGNLDIIEVKKPFANGVLTKTTYRDNSLPTRELSGSIMQAEKYVFHLSKWGREGERDLSRRYADNLPTGLTLKITNPKAIILMGRDRLDDGSGGLSAAQLFDLEIIKRKYTNMIDIMTYDDLLRRLDNIIAGLRQRLADASTL